MSVFTGGSALLIVDMLNDFVKKDGSLTVSEAEGIVERIAQLAEEARQEGVPVIYVNDSHDTDDEEFDRWPRHAEKGTTGAEVIEELNPRPGDYVVEKTRFSGFFKTDLEGLIERLGVDHLVITGTVTNICVLATAMDASMRGYRVSVPADGVAGLNEDDHLFALKHIEQVLGGDIL